MLTGLNLCGHFVLAGTSEIKIRQHFWKTVMEPHVLS